MGCSGCSTTTPRSYRLDTRVGALPLPRDRRREGASSEGGSQVLGQPTLAAVHTYDGSFIECFEAVVPEALRAFGPDLIFSQNGCDAHALVPLGDLRVTIRVYKHVPRRIHDLAHELCGGHWVAVGGGGYDIWRVVPRAWAALWATVSHQKLPEEIPEKWLKKWGEKSPVKLPPLTRDRADDYPSIGRSAQITDRNRHTTEVLLEK